MSTRSLLAIVSLLLAWPLAGQAESNQTTFIEALDRMMVSLGAESARDSKAIREAYKGHRELLVLDQYDALEEGLINGGLAPLPSDPLRFNLAPRLVGRFPIGEKDLDNQVSYIAARPATIGALLDVASRVKSGPVEITSLVRHTEYQRALRATNANATTSVPMHTMGMAFDIGLIHTPLETVYEIRDVLRGMRKAGEILFIGERRQLVFHVVPHPSRLGRFTDVYTRALGAPPASGSAPVVAFSPGPWTAGSPGVPRVTAEVVAFAPTVDFADEWWAADHPHGDVVIDVVGDAAGGPTRAAPAATANSGTVLFAGLVAVLLGLAGPRITRRPVHLRLFRSVQDEQAAA